MPAMCRRSYLTPLLTPGERIVALSCVVTSPRSRRGARLVGETASASSHGSGPPGGRPSHLTATSDAKRTRSVVETVGSAVRGTAGHARGGSLISAMYH